jgi:hypothetical protein
VRGWATEPDSRCKLAELDVVLKDLESRSSHS